MDFYSFFLYSRKRRRKIPLSVAPFWRISCPRQIPESRDIFLSTFQVFLFAYFIRRISFYCIRRTARPLHPQAKSATLNAARGGKKLNYTLFIAAARCACVPLWDNETPLWNWTRDIHTSLQDPQCIIFVLMHPVNPIRVRIVVILPAGGIDNVRLYPNIWNGDIIFWIYCLKEHIRPTYTLLRLISPHASMVELVKRPRGIRKMQI